MDMGMGRGAQEVRGIGRGIGGNIEIVGGDQGDHRKMEELGLRGLDKMWW